MIIIRLCQNSSFIKATKVSPIINLGIEIPNHVFDHHDKKDTGLFPGNNKF